MFTGHIVQCIQVGIQGIQPALWVRAAPTALMESEGGVYVQVYSCTEPLCLQVDRFTGLQPTFTGFTAVFTGFTTKFTGFTAKFTGFTTLFTRFTAKFTGFTRSVNMRVQFRFTWVYRFIPNPL